MENGRRVPEICYVDMGGTFTDAFIVNNDGSYGLGKAPSDPRNIIKALMGSLENGAQSLNMSLEDFLSTARIIGFGATVTINAILTGAGAKAGMLITRGFSDVFLQGRGKEAWVEFTRKDRMHPQCHRKPRNLIPKTLIREIPERIDSLGNEYVPLDEEAVRKAVQDLIDNGIEALAICFVYSYLNDSHERRAAEIAQKVIEKSGKKIPVYLSVDVNPVMRELSRANSTAIEARTGELVAARLRDAEKELRKYGFKGTFQVMQSSGGLTSAEVVKSIETVQSGPVGGVIAGRFIGDLFGENNIVTTDVGGTSFDVGIISRGQIRFNREPSVARHLVGTPIIEVFSIGAGGGTIARIDPYTKRLVVGPESAGAVPGPVCYDTGGTESTVTDADVIRGYIDPDYFLGGRIKLNKKKAIDVMKEKIADPLGISVVDAARAINDIIDLRMKENIVSMITSRGFNVAEYLLLAGGGGGPTHVAGYTDGLDLKGIAIFPFAAVFAAFGAACADYEHHYNHAINVFVPPNAKDEDKVQAGKAINEMWERLEARGFEDMARDGFEDKSLIKVKHLAMVRYGGQLNDLIVESPVARVNTPEDWDKLVDAFETLYENTYVKAAKYPQGGYQIFEAGLIMSVEKIKPILAKIERGSRKPPSASIRGKRDAYFGGEKMLTDVYMWSELLAGNIVEGPAIIESTTTNCVVPPNKRIEVGGYGELWLQTK